MGPMGPRSVRSLRTRRGRAPHQHDRRGRRRVRRDPGIERQAGTRKLRPARAGGGAEGTLMAICASRCCTGVAARIDGPRAIGPRDRCVHAVADRAAGVAGEIGRRASGETLSLTKLEAQAVSAPGDRIVARHGLSHNDRYLPAVHRRRLRGACVGCSSVSRLASSSPPVECGAPCRLDQRKLLHLARRSLEELEPVAPENVASPDRQPTVDRLALHQRPPVCGGVALEM